MQNTERKIQSKNYTVQKDTRGGSDQELFIKSCQRYYVALLQLHKEANMKYKMHDTEYNIQIQNTKYSLWFLTKSFSSKAGNNKVHDTILMQLHKEKLYFHLAPYRHSTPYIRINNETLNTGQIYDTLSKMCLKYNILLMMLRAC